MFDTPAPHALTLSGAQIVTPTGIRDGALRVEDGKIAGIGADHGEGRDLAGHYLIPGIVDLHTDHIERHVFPRLTVQWPFLPALLAHDAVIIAGGTTTVFDSLSVGASLKRPERREILGPLIDALEHGRAAGAFRADHMLHLRCEISDPTTMELVDDNIGRDITRLVSVMDHTPGDRQLPDIERWFDHMLKDMAVTTDEGRTMMAELLDRSARVGAQVRTHVIATAHAHAHTIMSHDDRSVAHVDQARAEGIAISEFPCTLTAARHARNSGMLNVAGAPNYLRGGSQSGNVGVAALLADDLVDALASDYIPRSPLDAAFAIAADPGLPHDLPAALALVTAAPARMAGLLDRGRIAVGLRADLVAVRLIAGQPIVSAAWRAGHQVF